MFAKEFILRSRKETNAKELTNIRHVEQWQTDPPAADKMSFYEDTASIPSRLYRESLDRLPSYSVKVEDNVEAKELERQRYIVLSQIQELEKKNDPKDADILRDAYATYETILKGEKMAFAESISANPYFDKYDVAGDSRNIVRELRSVIHEDIVDRGVNESKKLMERMFMR